MASGPLMVVAAWVLLLEEDLSAAIVAVIPLSPAPASFVN
jgi:hypothetical protein